MLSTDPFPIYFGCLAYSVSFPNEGSRWVYKQTKTGRTDSFLDKQLIKTCLVSNLFLVSTEI